MAPMRAVLLDAGGVLVVPLPQELAAVVAPHGGIADTEEIIRAHYAAIALADSDDGFDSPRYHEELLNACRVPLAARDACQVDMAAMVEATPHLWSYPLRGVAQALVDLAGHYRLGIISNSNGTVQNLLAELGLCQVGAGAATEVEVIVDSAVVGVEKPDPKIFRKALELMDLPAEEVGYVGDTRAFDVTGAKAAGLRPLHMDPYGLCLGGGHEHIVGIADLAGAQYREKPRTA